MAPSAPACPGCQSRMKVVETSGIEVDLCPFCGGLWLDAGELERLAGRALPIAAQRTSERRCARCARPMRTTQLQGHDVERCAGCGGLYLDAGELEAIAGRPLIEPSSEPSRAKKLREAPAEFDCSRCGTSHPWAQGYALPGGGRLCDRCLGLGPRISAEEVRRSGRDEDAGGRVNDIAELLANLLNGKPW